MRRDAPPFPASAEVFAIIRRMSSRRRKITLAKIHRTRGGSKTSLCEIIQRLERDKWIERGPFEPGKERPITLPNPKKRRRVK